MTLQQDLCINAAAGRVSVRMATEHGTEELRVMCKYVPREFFQCHFRWDITKYISCRRRASDGRGAEYTPSQQQQQQHVIVMSPFYAFFRCSGGGDGGGNSYVSLPRSRRRRPEAARAQKWQTNKTKAQRALQ